MKMVFSSIKITFAAVNSIKKKSLYFYKRPWILLYFPLLIIILKMENLDGSVLPWEANLDSVVSLISDFSL